jgi:hypothetical protein
MPTGRNDHLVPQMMIRRFAGDDGKLAELYKPTLTLATRRKSPKGILCSKDYYSDQVASFDDETLKPIEQAFARVYPALADGASVKSLSGQEGAALVEWIAAMLVRTQGFAICAAAVAQKLGGVGDLVRRLVPQLVGNIFRTLQYSEFQDYLSRPNLQWRVKTYADGECVVLSDVPVRQTNGLDAGGPATIVPLSKHRVLFCGSEEAVERCNVPVEKLNSFLAGMAIRSIYAADSNCLEAAARTLRGEGEWCAAARRPVFGLLDFIQGKDIPPEVDLKQWWNQVKDANGPPIKQSKTRLSVVK